MQRRTVGRTATQRMPHACRRRASLVGADEGSSSRQAQPVCTELPTFFAELAVEVEPLPGKPEEAA